ncbi:hypothetical protein GCK32_019679, partial [Trichostrongylus colubriformis]
NFSRIMCLYFFCSPFILFVQVEIKSSRRLLNYRELLARANKKSLRPAYVVDELRVAISLDDIREVTSKVKELMSMDCDDPYAALGVTLSNLMNGKVDDASAQLTFMKEANPNISNHAVSFLTLSDIWRGIVFCDD